MLISWLSRRSGKKPRKPTHKPLYKILGGSCISLIAEKVQAQNSNRKSVSPLLVLNSTCDCHPKLNYKFHRLIKLTYGIDRNLLRWRETKGSSGSSENESRHPFRFATAKFNRFTGQARRLRNGVGGSGVHRLKTTTVPIGTAVAWCRLTLTVTVVLLVDSHLPRRSLWFSKTFHIVLRDVRM